MARRGYRREGGSITAKVIPALRGAAQYATDKAIRFGLEDTKRTIRGVGLGRLANAVGATSSLKKGRRPSDGSAWGAIFAKGGSEGRGNQALLAYSEGAAIAPLAGRQWLAFATDAIPTRVGRKKMTPELYNGSSLVNTIGKLHFVPISAREAVLVAQDVTVSRKTKRAKGYAGRVPRGSDRRKSVVAFILIRYTRRARRFSQAEIMKRASATVATFAAEYQDQRASKE